MPDAAPTSTPSLRAAGMRQTPQREGILRVLKNSDRPLTVEEIWERMPERRSGLPTVYRNLERFVREGWAESIMGLLLFTDRKSTRLNSSHSRASRMPSSA